MHPSKAQPPISHVNLNLGSYKTLISNKRYLEIVRNMLYLILWLLLSRRGGKPVGLARKLCPLCPCVLCLRRPRHWALPIRLPVHFLVKTSMIRDLLPAGYIPQGSFDFRLIMSRGRPGWSFERVHKKSQQFGWLSNWLSHWPGPAPPRPEQQLRCWGPVSQ